MLFPGVLIAQIHVCCISRGHKLDTLHIGTIYLVNFDDITAVNVFNVLFSVAFSTFPIYSLLGEVFGACFQLLVHRYTVTSSYPASRWFLLCQIVASCWALRLVAVVMLWISLWLFLWIFFSYCTFKITSLRWGGLCLSFHSNQWDAIDKHMVITRNMRERWGELHMVPI